MLQIMFNRCVSDRDPRRGTNEYVVFKPGAAVRIFQAAPAVADRYARRYGLKHASPMDYWRDVVCA